VGGVPHDVVRIRSARPEEGERLRQIAIDAKAYWGYDVDWVRSWAARGDFSPEELTTNPFLVAEVEGCTVAFAKLIPRGDVAWLDDLWVDPTWIGRGVGTRLFEAAAERARELGAERMEWEAELNAVGFYEKRGGRYVRNSEETELGRILPVMGIELATRSAD
jgi:GNAT superfamily N-acetyltransferase